MARHREAEPGRDEWRACACARSIPDHVDAPPDPAGGDGCGMAWRPLPDSEDGNEFEERHITVVQPGGHLRQDVPAGLGLPNDHRTGENSEENQMVGPMTHATRGGEWL